MLLKAQLFIIPALALDYQWEAWKRQYGLKFTTGYQDHKRYQIFKKSREFVKNHNLRASQGLETFTVSLNKFAAMDDEEFKFKFLNVNQIVGLDLEYQCDGNVFIDNGDAPLGALSYTEGFPWAGVTPVKDQGSCGSCWTFGASAAIEGFMCSPNQNLKDCTNWNGLSTQQMVDCASYTDYNKEPDINLNPYDNNGCSGGWESNALRYVQIQGGQNNWDDYTYISGETKTEQTCAYDPTTANLNIFDGCARTTRGDETELMNAISQIGPMSIGIDAGQQSFRLYSHGVYSDENCNNVSSNHAVAVVGYGRALDGQLYWEIKNSWGTGWGSNGFMQMARNYNNMCGIANDAHYVWKN